MIINAYGKYNVHALLVFFIYIHLMDVFQRLQLLKICIFLLPLWNVSYDLLQIVCVQTRLLWRHIHRWISPK